MKSLWTVYDARSFVCLCHYSDECFSEAENIFYDLYKWIQREEQNIQKNPLGWGQWVKIKLKNNMEQEIIAEWGPSLTSQLIKNLKKVFGGSRSCFVNHVTKRMSA